MSDKTRTYYYTGRITHELNDAIEAFGVAIRKAHGYMVDCISYTYWDASTCYACVKLIDGGNMVFLLNPGRVSLESYDVADLAQVEKAHALATSAVAL